MSALPLRPYRRILPFLVLAAIAGLWACRGHTTTSPSSSDAPSASVPAASSPPAQTGAGVKVAGSVPFSDYGCMHIQAGPVNFSNDGFLPSDGTVQVRFSTGGASTPNDYVHVAVFKIIGNGAPQEYNNSNSKEFRVGAVEIFTIGVPIKNLQECVTYQIDAGCGRNPPPNANYRGSSDFIMSWQIGNRCAPLPRPTPEPTPTPAPRITPTPDPCGDHGETCPTPTSRPTPTPTPRVTPTPTATPRVTPTATTTPTATPTPRSTPTPTPPPTPSPTPTPPRCPLGAQAHQIGGVEVMWNNYISITSSCSGYWKVHNTKSSTYRFRVTTSSSNANSGIVISDQPLSAGQDYFFTDGNAQLTVWVWNGSAWEYSSSGGRSYDTCQCST